MRDERLPMVGEIVLFRFLEPRTGLEIKPGVHKINQVAAIRPAIVISMNEDHTLNLSVFFEPTDLVDDGFSPVREARFAPRFWGRVSRGDEPQKGAPVWSWRHQ